MGLLDAILGRSKPKRPDLDALFSVPTAALTLEAAAGFRPTGRGSVCYRESEGGAFDRLEDDVAALLGGSRPKRSTDAYGWSWLALEHDPLDVGGLCTELHAINSSLEDTGFGAALLCSIVGFDHEDGRRLGLVYLYKRGTFYPFAPVGEGEALRRDNALELQVRAVIGTDLPFETDVTKWFPVWGAPGL
jgi:hypothetical protein